MMASQGSFTKIVHIVPLGHEIDRAVRPLETSPGARVHLLAIAPEDEGDPEMRMRQENCTREVTDRLRALSIEVCLNPVNTFDVLEVMKVASRLILQEKADGNIVHVNMSACGKKTAFAVTIAAMYHDVPSYYVPAKEYAVGENWEKTKDHGMTVVESNGHEPLQQFPIIKPKDANVELLAELYRRTNNDAPSMRSGEIITFFHEKSVPGFQDIPPRGKLNPEQSRLRRTLLNRINRSYLKELEDQGYIKKKMPGREFFVSITSAGSHIACVSGLV